MGRQSDKNEGRGLNTPIGSWSPPGMPKTGPCGHARCRNKAAPRIVVEKTIATGNPHYVFRCAEHAPVD